MVWCFGVVVCGVMGHVVVECLCGVVEWVCHVVVECRCGVVFLCSGVVWTMLWWNAFVVWCNGPCCGGMPL